MANIYDMSDTWNDGATTFNAIKMNVTDTASASASLLMDLQVGGASKVTAKKSGTILGTAGANSAPTFSFVGNENTGITYASGTLNAVVSGTQCMAWQSNGQVTYSNGPIAFGGNSFVYSDGANILALRNSTNAQTFNIYNTYTDASNYERGFMKWDSNVLKIGTEALGTGTARNVVLNGANRVAKISDVSTGTDGAYETAINAIIDALEAHGLAATV